MKIDVIGAGAWGTALALHLAQHSAAHRVTLHARDPEQAAQLANTHENARYLPGWLLPPNLAIAVLQPAGALADAGAGAGTKPDLQPRPAASMPESDLLVLACPTSGLLQWLPAMAGAGLSTPVVWVCKGFVAGGDGELAHELAARLAPQLAVGVLSGPSFAQEVAAGKPCALVAASVDRACREQMVQAFHGRHLRVYPSDDIVGVEVGGAVKNVMAIACGVCDGLGLGHNARAALITRGLAETARLGAALGARLETFMGLSGLGDLVLTATGDLSRNRRVGLALAQGHAVQQILESLGHVAEGVASARAIAARARALGVDMPIVDSVCAMLAGTETPAQLLARLMGREAPVGEFGGPMAAGPSQA